MTMSASHIMCYDCNMRWTPDLEVMEHKVSAGTRFGTRNCSTNDIPVSNKHKNAVFESYLIMAYFSTSLVSKRGMSLRSDTSGSISKS